MSSELLNSNVQMFINLYDNEKYNKIPYINGINKLILYWVGMEIDLDNILDDCIDTFYLMIYMSNSSILHLIQCTIKDFLDTTIKNFILDYNAPIFISNKPYYNIFD